MNQISKLPKWAQQELNSLQIQLANAEAHLQVKEEQINNLLSKEGKIKVGAFDDNEVIFSLNEKEVRVKIDKFNRLEMSFFGAADFVIKPHAHNLITVELIKQ